MFNLKLRCKIFQTIPHSKGKRYPLRKPWQNHEKNMKTMKTLTKPRKTKENKETRGNQDKSGKRHPWHPLREVIIVTMDDQEVWHTYFLFFWEFSIRIILIFKSTFRSFKPPEFSSSRPLWVPTDREQEPHCGLQLVDSLSPGFH